MKKISHIGEIGIYRAVVAPKPRVSKGSGAPFGRGQGGNAPLSPSAEGEIPLAVKNGEWGEETDRFPRGGEQDRRPL